MQIKIIHLIAISLIAYNVTYTQGLFPLHHGDLWQYIIYDEGGLYKHFSVSILKDTVLENARNYAYCSGSFPARFLRQEGQKVYAYRESDSLEFVLFKFDASINDTISRSGDSLNPRCIVLRNKGYDSQYKQNIWIFENVSGVVTLQRWTVADNLGVVQWAGELTPRYTLTGARIEGIMRYGIILYAGQDGALQNDNLVLCQNYPNPFNPNTIIRYQLLSTGEVGLKVYDILGREIRTLADELQKAGEHTVNFNASGLSSGMYFYRLITKAGILQKKMLLLR
ncbi:MAG: T9SS C-terminal target domain-containing protein [Ignavibacteriae bacterium]|nr:MAG: T9SS C-terminal target domain-containing protein [Ignavibacteriota bacterium]